MQLAMRRFTPASMVGRLISFTWRASAHSVYRMPSRSSYFLAVAFGIQHRDLTYHRAEPTHTSVTAERSSLSDMSNPTYNGRSATSAAVNPVAQASQAAISSHLSAPCTHWLRFNRRYLAS